MTNNCELSNNDTIIVELTIAFIGAIILAAFFYWREDIQRKKSEKLIERTVKTLDKMEKIINLNELEKLNRRKTLLITFKHSFWLLTANFKNLDRDIWKKDSSEKKDNLKWYVTRFENESENIKTKTDLERNVLTHKEITRFEQLSKSLKELSTTLSNDDEHLGGYQYLMNTDFNLTPDTILGYAIDEINDELKKINN